MSCPQCQAAAHGSASCDRCGAALAGPASRGLHPEPVGQPVPQDAGEQFLPHRAGRYIPGSDTPASQFRPDWRRLTRAEQAAGGATLVVFVSLFLPWFGSAASAPHQSERDRRARIPVIVILLAVLMAGYLLQRSGREDSRPACR